MENTTKKLFNARPIFYGFLAFLLGISCTKFLFDANLSYCLLVGFAFAALLVFCVWKKVWKPFVFLFCIFLFGIGWFFLGQSMFLGKRYESQVAVTGRVSDDVSYSSYGTSANIVLTNVTIDGKAEDNIALTVYIDDIDDFAIGDVLAFDSEIESVDLFTLQNFNSFFYRDKTPYMASVDISDVTKIDHGIGVDEAFRLHVKDLLFANMSAENAGTAYAVLFGDKSDVNDDTYDVYEASGILHLLTVSGLHVGFLIALLAYLLSLFKVRGLANFLTCFVFVAFYAYLCGFAPSILRASIMGLVLIGARLSGKCYDSLNTLGFAGALILLFSPLSALDLGFLMSFFSVLCIFTLYPVINKMCSKIFPKFVSQALALSFCAQLGIMPFIAEFYASFNFLSVFVNLLVVPFFALVYPLLFLSALIVAILPFMGFVLAVSSFGFSIVQWVAEFFSQTYLIISLQPINVLIIACCFVSVFLLSKFFMASVRVKGIALGSLIVLCSVIGFADAFSFQTSTAVFGYNYSNSTILLTNKSGDSIIIDAGYSSYTKNLAMNAGIKNVDAAFLLHNSSAKVDTLNELGVSHIIRSDAGEGLDNEILFEHDESGSVSGFDFVYLDFDDRLVGLEIAFDEQKVFLFDNLSPTDAAVSFVSGRDYDIIFLGKHEEFASDFVNDVTIVAYQDFDNVDKNFLQDGNLACEIKNEKEIWRTLD